MPRIEITQISVTYADGTVDTFTVDEGWTLRGTVDESPIPVNNYTETKTKLQRREFGASRRVADK